MSTPGVEYLLVECDGQLDNIKATHLRRRRSTGMPQLFSAAFPLAPLMTHQQLGRIKDGRLQVPLYASRIQPLGPEDIGTFQSIFELMNYLGIASSFLAIVYRTDVLQNYWPAKWGRRSRCAHQEDAFMVICSFYFGFMLMLRVLIDDVPFDVELQIKRNDFLNSKIIDHVADEADTALSPTALTVAVEVKDRDTMEPYSTYDKLFGRGLEEAVRKVEEISPRPLRPVLPRAHDSAQDEKVDVAVGSAVGRLGGRRDRVTRDEQVTPWHLRPVCARAPAFHRLAPCFPSGSRLPSFLGLMARLY